MREEDPEAYIEVIDAKHREQLEDLRTEHPDTYERERLPYELRWLREVRSIYATMYRELAEELGVEE